MGQCISETAPATVNQAAAVPFCEFDAPAENLLCNGGRPLDFRMKQCFDVNDDFTYMRSVCRREGEVSDRERGLCRCPPGMVYDRTETKENAGFGAKCVPCEAGMHNPFGNCLCDSTGEIPRLRLGSNMHGFMKDILECAAPTANPSPQTAFRNFQIAKASYFPLCHAAGETPACCLSKITGYGCCRGDEVKAVVTRAQTFDAPPYRGDVTYQCSCGANRVYDRDDHLTGYRSPLYAHAQCVLCPSTSTFNSERLRCECPDLRNPFLLDRLQCAEPETTSTTTTTAPTNPIQVGVTLTLPNTVESVILKYDQCNVPVEQQPACCSKDGYGCCREGEENAIDFDTRAEWCRCPYGSVYDRREYSVSSQTGTPVRKDIAKCTPCPEGSVFDRFSKSCLCSDKTDPFTLPGRVCSGRPIVYSNRNRGQSFLNTEVLTSILAPFTDYGETLPKQLCELTTMNNPTSCCRGYNLFNMRESRLDIYSSALDACECPAGHVFDRYETSATQGSARCVACPDHMNYEAQIAGGRCVCKNGKITDNAENPFDCSCQQPYPVLRNGICTNPCGPYQFSNSQGACTPIPKVKQATVDMLCANPQTAHSRCCGQLESGEYAKCTSNDQCVYNSVQRVTGCACDASKGLVYDMNYNCVCPENEVFDNAAQRCECAPGRSRDPVTSLCGPCPAGSVTALEGDCVLVPWPATNGTCGTQNTRCSQRSQSTKAFRTSTSGVVSTQLSDLSYERTWLPNIYGHCTPTFRFRYRNFHIKHDVGNADWLQASCVVPEGNVLNEINKQGPTSTQIFMGYCKHAKFMSGSDRGLETKHLCYGRGFRLLRLRIVQDRTLFFQTSDASVDLNVLTSNAEVCECFQGFHGPDCESPCPANCNGACDSVTGQCCSGPRIMPLLSVGIRNDSISVQCANTNFGAVCPFSALTTPPIATTTVGATTSHAASTTMAPTTIHTTTVAPTTMAPTTIATTTIATTTIAPTTIATTTIAPTTIASTTIASTTISPTTSHAASTTSSSTTSSSTTTTPHPTSTSTTTTQPPTTMLAIAAPSSSSSTFFSTEIMVAAGISAAALLSACLCVLFFRRGRGSPSAQFNAQTREYASI